MWIAGSLQVPVVGLYGTIYITAYDAIQLVNLRAEYLQVEGTLDGIPPERVWSHLEQAVMRGHSEMTAASAHRLE